MTWLFVAILSYVFFAIVAVGDKYLLTGPIRDHTVYAFYIGVLGMAVFFLAPFVGFSFIGWDTLWVALLSGAAFVGALLFFFYGLRFFEASRIVPATGGLTPLTTLIVSMFLFSEARMLSAFELGAFMLLTAGSVFIMRNGKGTLSRKGFLIALSSSLLFGVSFATSKQVFLEAPFWPALMWMRVGGFIAALGVLMFSHAPRNALLGHHRTKREKKSLGITLLFLGNQSIGAAGGLLQNFAIFLAPPLYIAFVNALGGIQYILVLLFTGILAWKFPNLFKEKFTRGVFFKKLAAILLIFAGIAILAFL